MKNKNYLKTLLIVLLLVSVGCSKDDNLSPRVSSNFSSYFVKIYENQPVKFIDKSTGSPTSWQWTFEGGTPSTSNEQNPSITYTSEGVYKVVLVASNEGNSHEIIKEDYIVVTDNLLNSLVGKFQLNGNGDDSSDFQNDGTVIGNVVPTQDRKGIDNSAMLFSEYEGFIDIGDVSELKLTSEISISVWVNANGNYSGWETIVNKWQDDPSTTGGTGFGYYLGLDPNGLVLRWNVTSHFIELNTAFPVDEWVHISVTYDGQFLKLFINGNLETQAEASGKIADNKAPFRIGHQSDRTTGLSGFNGGIDDIHVYSRAITTEEVIELYRK